MATYFIKASKGENLWRESVSKAEVIILSDMITKVTSHHLCHILLFRGKLQMLPPHSRGKAYTRAWTPGGGVHWKPSQSLTNQETNHSPYFWVEGNGLWGGRLSLLLHIFSEELAFWSLLYYFLFLLSIFTLFSLWKEQMELACFHR